MKKWIILPLLALCTALTGCSALLERSYSSVEPYTNHYWDIGAEDTLKAENYQELVNSMLMLVEEGAQEGVIRCYMESAYAMAIQASREIRQETISGSYLLEGLHFTNDREKDYSTLTCQMTYREDAEPLGTILSLSNTQSLIDLLRVAVSEGHRKLTARFIYEIPREDVTAAVEALWQEICRTEMEQLLPGLSTAPVPSDDSAAGEETAPVAEETQPEEPAPAPETRQEGEPVPAAEPPEGEVLPESQDESSVEEEDPIQYPPCPWSIRFYPKEEGAGIVELILK